MAGQQSTDELQRWMLAAVTEPAKVGEAALNETILPSRQQSAADRLAVYQHAYVARLLEVLREQFPCTRFAAGDDVFDRLALGYLQAHPPRSYTLAHLADHLPDYLERTRPADWGEFLVEVARLEQAIDRVFDGPGPEGGLPRSGRPTPGRGEGMFRGLEGLTEKAGMEGEPNCGVNWEANTGKMPVPRAADESLRLSFVPGFELHEFRHPVSTFYTAWKAGEEPAWPGPEAQCIALLRRDYIVRRYELSREQFEMLGDLKAGKTLGEALAAVKEGRLDERVANVREWFTEWTAGGFFAGTGNGLVAREH